jgi:hypothetical protein
MPGLLKPSARCPMCGDALAALVDTSNSLGVVREYFHEKGSPKARRRRRCKRFFGDHDMARAERSGLEAPTA